MSEILLAELVRKDVTARLTSRQRKELETFDPNDVIDSLTAFKDDLMQQVSDNKARLALLLAQESPAYTDACAGYTEWKARTDFVTRIIDQKIRAAKKRLRKQYQKETDDRKSRVGVLEAKVAALEATVAELLARVPQ